MLFWIILAKQCGPELDQFSDCTFEHIPLLIWILKEVNKLPDRWKKIQKKIYDGIQPESNIIFEYRKDVKKPYWRARIRFRKLKKYGLETKCISSKNYDTMDAFYFAALAMRNELQAKIEKIENAELSGNPVDLNRIRNNDLSIGHTLDFIMGYHNSNNKEISQNNHFDTIFALSEKPTTISAARYKYLNYIRPEFGSRTIESITTEEIEKNLIQSGKSLNEDSLIELKCTWKKLFIIARRNGYRKDNPVEDVVINTFKAVDHDAAEQRRLGSKKERRQVDNDTFAQIIKIVLDENRPIVGGVTVSAALYKRQMIAHALILMRNTGLRPAECFALRIQDVTLNRDENGNITSGSISINHAMALRENNERYIHETKTQSSMHSIPINKEAAQTIDDMWSICQRRRIGGQKTRKIFNESNSVQFDNSDFLFTDYYGTLPSAAKISEYLRRWLRPYEIKYSMYTNRHQFITDMSENSIATAQSLARHTATSTTLSYIEGNEKNMEKAISRIDNDFLSLTRKDNNDDN